MDNKDLFQVATELDGIHAYLAEDYDAICFVYDGMESEGYQREETFEEVTAVIFGHRVPGYLSMLNLIRRDMEKNLEDLNTSVQRLYQLRNEKCAAHED